MRFTNYKVLIKFLGDKTFQSIYTCNTRQQALEHKADLLSASIPGLQVKVSADKVGRYGDGLLPWV